MRSREKRALKNARWYVVRGMVGYKVGWGDLSDDDLRELASDSGARTWLVLPEAPDGWPPFSWPEYHEDEPDRGVSFLAQSAAAGIVRGTPYLVRPGRAGRAEVERGFPVIDVAALVALLSETGTGVP
ncbi:hypothetical protein ACT17Q_14895 [Cellulomonas sp. CW35]|uniref:hypothetical protein n=1 Tax=Cellulomonas sp. CW35 TaxID=3458249 RepID=UPI004034BD66